jgi:putative hydrolase of the HAD superfamily
MIFFDIDGTLIDHASASAIASLCFYDRFHDYIPHPRGQFPQIWENILTRHFNRFCRGELSLTGQRHARMREVFGNKALTDEECGARYRVFVKEYELRTQPYADVEGCLEQLGGVRLRIISNGERDQQIGKLERSGLLKYFAVLVFPQDVGLGKLPLIFYEACSRAGLNARECIYVGDDLIADVNASQSVGMRAVWLDRYGVQGTPNSVSRITTLHQLKPSLRGGSLMHVRTGHGSQRRRTQ